MALLGSQRPVSRACSSGRWPDPGPGPVAGLRAEAPPSARRTGRPGPRPLPCRRRCWWRAAGGLSAPAGGRPWPPPPGGWSWAWGLEPGLSQGLAYALRSYGRTDSPGRCLLKRSVDQLPAGLGCCGVRGPTDWFHVQWISQRFLDLNDSRVRDQLHSNIAGLYLMDSVPFSCCNPASPRPCIQHHLRDPSAHYNYQPGPEDLNLWTRGCHEALLDHYSSILNWVGAALLLSSLLQFSLPLLCCEPKGLFLCRVEFVHSCSFLSPLPLWKLGLLITMRYLIISTLAAEAQGDPDCETVGYLLERGPVDTLRSAAKALRSALSSNAVQTDTAPIVEKMPDK
ncbi:LOW QUALITY PROTEIN: RDS/peripherin-like protein xRDS35 [Leucoraja erinacea]|uniref:LOW QUALITY PROTEIN: RDS/peripherin-like protein xRDS35 n=1 Tax=Leucoraja erinaceus TaxID=7782 RepID=UPI0024578173|nr:LOW QUALITY PROTEIN: RDS/peripherin-like protein xRDS35 [Leucoraja erinacea]